MVENNFGGLSTKIWSKNLWDYLDIGRLFPKGRNMETMTVRAVNMGQENF